MCYYFALRVILPCFVNGFLAVLLTISAGVAVVAVRESPELKEKAHKRKKVTQH